MQRPLLYRFALLTMLLLAIATAFAQSGFYVPKKGKIFFKGDTATVFTDVTNEGKIGIGKKAVVNFTGAKWTNAHDAEIATDTTNGVAEGGLVRFMGNQTQYIDGGYNAAVKSGPMFYSLSVENSNGVELTGSSAKVSAEIRMLKGLFFLNQQMLAVGNGHPGLITGYDSSRYFVTNTKNALLIREGLVAWQDWVTFPVGSKAHSYTPAAVRATTEMADDFHASVFDSVYVNATTGTSLMHQSVGKTWQIGKRFRPGEAMTEIALQHLNADEGAFFTANKARAYISQYVNDRWDIGYPQNHPGIGHLTTGPYLLNSGANIRTFYTTMGTAGYFTKFTGAGDTVLTKLWFNAYRINPSLVRTYWITRPEINTKYFVVQRRLANEASFKNLDTVASKALNGFSASALSYELMDPNGYRGISFYRLLLVTHNGDSTYSQIVAVGNKAGEFNSDLWPNPTTGVFTISINTAQPVKQIILWDVLGQKVMVIPTNGQRVIRVDANKLAAANYYVSLVGEADNVVETKKLIIAR